MASTSRALEPRKIRAIHPFSRLVALVIGVENYRAPARGQRIPSVDYAHADADAFAAALREIYGDVEADIELLEDSEATLTVLKETLRYKIKTLSAEDLFVLYYAGHGLHGEGGNRLATWDTNPHNIGGTTLLLSEVVLEPLGKSLCQRSLIFVDACAAGFRDLTGARDVIADLDIEEVNEFLDTGRYCGVFFSCSPGEKSYPSRKLGHGIWTAFLLKALRGAKGALERDRWLTDASLRDWLKREVSRYITRETSISGTQTPQAIVSASNSFRIRHIPEPKPNLKTELAALSLKKRDDYLEGIETGRIRDLSGFKRGVHRVPQSLNDRADTWVRRLLADQVADDLQGVYNTSKKALQLRGRDMRIVAEDAQGNVDTPFFRYSVEAMQNPEDAAEYAVVRHLNLLRGWLERRTEIGSIFSNEFGQIVIEFEGKALTYEDVVDKLEEVSAGAGGDVEEDRRRQRITYASPDGAKFVLDLNVGRLEMSFGVRDCMKIIDAARDYKLVLAGEPSPMLALPGSRD